MLASEQPREAGKALLDYCSAALDAGRMVELMAVDKKVLAGQLRLILLDDIGKATMTSEFPSEALMATLQSCRDAA